MVVECLEEVGTGSYSSSIILSMSVEESKELACGESKVVVDVHTDCEGVVEVDIHREGVLEVEVEGEGVVMVDVHVHVDVVGPLVVMLAE